MPKNEFIIEKAVLGVPTVITPNTIYLVRRGFGFDIAISDAEGVSVKWLNNISSIWNNTIIPSSYNVSHTLSVIVPYMFNTRSSSTSWNTGFGKILESVKKYKTLKFYVILDLYNLNSLNETNAREAIQVLNGMGAIPLAYIPNNNPNFGTEIQTIIDTLINRYSGKFGIFFHNSVTLSDYVYNTLSITMCQKYLYPLVIYTNNNQQPTPTLFDNAHGDIHMYHINASNDSDITFYDEVLSLYDYHMKCAFIYNVYETDVATALRRYNNTGCIFVTNTTNPNNLITSTLPSYYDTLISEINKVYTNDIISSYTGDSLDLVGSIQFFTHTNITGRYLFANGASVSRTTYADLFNKIGTIYGSKNSSSFNLPDLRDKYIYCLNNQNNIGATVSTMVANYVLYGLATYIPFDYIYLYPCIRY